MPLRAELLLWEASGLPGASFSSFTGFKLGMISPVLEARSDAGKNLVPVPAQEGKTKHDDSV